MGISFAVPADTAMNSLKQIVQYGEVRHIWLGFSVSPKFGDSPTTLQKSVLVVTNVENGSPVFEAGLEEGDILTHINDSTVSDIPTAKKLIANIQVGSEIKFRVLRDNKPLEFSFTAKLPPNSRTKT